MSVLKDLVLTLGRLYEIKPPAERLQSAIVCLVNDHTKVILDVTELQMEYQPISVMDHGRLLYQSLRYQKVHFVFPRHKRF